MTKKAAKQVDVSSVGQDASRHPSIKKTPQPSVSKTVGQTPTQLKNTSTDTLSNSKMKKIKSALVKNKAYSYCGTSNCDVCARIYTECPITKCTHASAHALAFFPHLSRKLVRTIHSTRNYLLLRTVHGIANPLFGYASRSAPSTSGDQSIPSLDRKRKLSGTVNTTSVSDAISLKKALRLQAAVQGSSQELDQDVVSHDPFANPQY